VNQGWIIKYSYLIFGAVILLGFGAHLYFAAKSHKRNGKRSILEYLLVWPLLFQPMKKARQRSTIASFIVTGLVVLILMIMMLLDSSRG
jgi:hypothetical protein